MAHRGEPDRPRIRTPAFDIAGTELVRLAHIMAKPARKQHVAIDADRPHDRFQAIGERQSHARHATEVVGLSSTEHRRSVVVCGWAHLLEALELRLREREGKRLYNLIAQI